MDVHTALPLEPLGPGRADQLTRIRDAGLVQQGRVFLLSFEPIRTEMGARWSGRREIVWETFERDLTRAMPAPDQFIRVTETSFLAAISSTDSYSGQVRCAEVFRHILAFFLGRSEDSDLSMSRVSALAPDSVSSEPIDPAGQPPPPLSLAARSPASLLVPEGWDPPLSSRHSTLTFVSQRSGEIEVEIRISPVWRLDCNLVGAYAIRRRLSQPLSELSDRDQEAVDVGVADFLATLMVDYQKEGGAFAILCPFTFTTLSSRNARQRLLHRCGPMLEAMRRAVVLELDGLVRGTPVGRVHETLAMCRSMARARTLSIRDSSATDMLYGEHGAEGVAIDARAFSERQLTFAVSQVRRSTANIVVHGVPRAWDLERLHRSGVSHASADPFGRDAAVANLDAQSA